jgi:hypothetical protein
MIVKQQVLFSKEECELIITLQKTNQQYWESKDRSYNSLVLQYNENTEWIFNRLKNFFELETEIKIFKLKPYIHFHKYISGDWFGRHNDIRGDRISAVGVLLNDNFKGGDFKLYNPTEVILNKVVGNTYIFDVTIDHEITPILNDERYSLLWFLERDNIKVNNKLI